MDKKMNKQIRISEELCKSAEQKAKLYNRTKPLQIKYWAELGKIAEENPNKNLEEIKKIHIKEKLKILKNKE